MSAALTQPAAVLSPSETPTNAQGTRETIESIIVAFILAFLFRAFVAEAFVIPTGSMAPTLMGAHKDVFCQHCGQQYQASASSEIDSDSGAYTPFVTVASTCSTCRGLNAYDLAKNSNHATFSGDRILVSKFDYVFAKPKRWEVFVFKFPGMARMNYIKRLVGLPGESLLIQDGDVYTRPEGAAEWTIARKPATKIQAMRQIVSDTKYQAVDLVSKGWPSLWQPTPPESAGGWHVSQSESTWSAELASSGEPQWLRYYHKFLDEQTWMNLLSGGELREVDPYRSSLITDYLAYNSYYQCSRDLVYQKPNFTKLKSKITADNSALDVAIDEDPRFRNSLGRSNDGHHWVGDLSGDFQVEIASQSGELLLDLVEFGVHFNCSIDVATGQAVLTATGSNLPATIFGEEASLTAATSLRGRGSYRVEFANFDDQLVLWIDGKVAKFNKPAEFDSRKFRTAAARRPYWTADDPLDAAPVAIGGRNLDIKLTRARVHRDIYYIAVQHAGFVNDFSDYDLDRLAPMLSAIPDPGARNRMNSAEQVLSAVYANPQWWSETNLFSQRGTLAFQLEPDQYFPMGDNSSHSSDARAWIGHNFVEQKFLLGKALLVFWPHTWNTPIPFAPNFSRMGLIR